MFRQEHFGRSSAEVNGWVSGTDTISDNNGANSFMSMSSKLNNLKKLNDQKYKSSANVNQNLTSTSTNSYKQIADDWSHSIYLLNLNPYSNESIKQMNSCKEIWDKNSLFDPEKVNFDFGYCKNFIKLQIDGTHPNIDLVVSAQA
jgi:hypothetical protein